MELKKSGKANLDKQSVLFFLIGLVFALLAFYGFFNYLRQYREFTKVEIVEEEATGDIVVEIIDDEPEDKQPEEDVPLEEDLDKEPEIVDEPEVREDSEEDEVGEECTDTEDDDLDGVPNCVDQCFTREGAKVNAEGCEIVITPEDKDGDGITDDVDICIGTLPEYVTFVLKVGKYIGCSDRDGDKIRDIDDKCADENNLLNPDPARPGCLKEEVVEEKDDWSNRTYAWNELKYLPMAKKNSQYGKNLRKSTQFKLLEKDIKNLLSEELSYHLDDIRDILEEELGILGYEDNTIANEPNRNMKYSFIIQKDGKVRVNSVQPVGKVPAELVAIAKEMANSLAKSSRPLFEPGIYQKSENFPEHATDTQVSFKFPFFHE